MNDGQVRWALLGAGWIARTAIGKAIHTADGARLDVVASRDRQRGELLEPLRYTTTNYQAALEDPDVDAVYIALDNAGHERWSRAALDCGKIVVCEKPLTPHAGTTERLFEYACQSQGLLVEAVWNLWHPRTQRAMHLLAEGAIGEVREIEGAFTFQGVPQGNYRLDPHRGGGALLDVGCYPLTAAAWATNGALLELEHASVQRRDKDVDITSEARFSTGRQIVAIRASFVEPEHQSLAIAGSRGTLEWRGGDAFTSYMQPSRLAIHDGQSSLIEEFEAVDPYRIMIENISAHIMTGAGWLPMNVWSLRVAQAIDQVLDR
jgi:D-xylose 1-dehydrogenase (NADP+, D-xylono-1,5-lactone-forming)